MENKFAKPTTLENMGFTHPKNPLIGDWGGRKEWVENALKKYKPRKLISSNTKTEDPSLNLPIVGHCINQTDICKSTCYAMKGTQAFSVAQLKAEYLSRYLLGTDLRQLIGECSVVKSIRLNGGGDLLPGHVPAILKLAKVCKETVFWGMSRNLEVLKDINGAGLKNLSLLYSIDASTKKEDWEFYDGGIVFGPKLSTDIVPVDDRIRTVFPVHKGGKTEKNVVKHHKDCKSVYDHNIKCSSCKRCWVATPLHHKG